MKKSKFTESQLVGILKAQESGKSVADICREHGISQGTFYQWKAKYSGIDVPQLTRMKELESELSQYKKMYSTGEPAELARQHYLLKDIIVK
jgi:putative transposase